MKNVAVYILLLSICLGGCSSLVPVEKVGVLSDGNLCANEDVQASTNFIEIDSDILQGITIQNISKQDCILNTPPSITATALDGKDVTKDLFNLSIKESTTQQAPVVLTREGGIQVFTILWKDPCTTPILAESSLNLNLGQFTAITLPKFDKELTECQNIEEKIGLEITDFTSPP